MAQKGNLLSVRQDIRVVDATIRDGGLCNDFRFSDEFVSDLYKANLKAGVDYMEFGYKASKEIFDEDDFGKWKFCNDDDIRAIVGEGNPKMKIAVMADVGRTDFEEDIIPKSESPIDLVRIATYINTIPAAVEMIEYCAKQGYETTINIMAISKARTEDLKTALEILGQTPVSCFYIARIRYLITGARFGNTCRVTRPSRYTFVHSRHIGIFVLSRSAQRHCLRCCIRTRDRYRCAVRTCSGRSIGHRNRGASYRSGARRQRSLIYREHRFVRTADSQTYIAL